MLWTLIKILLFIAIIAGVTVGAEYLMNEGQSIQLIIAGREEYVIGPLMMVILAAVLVGVMWVIFKLVGLLIATLRFLNGHETAISRFFDKKRQQRGYEAMSDALLALASGEGQTALSKASKAERFLNKPQLTNLLSAQAAELSGDKKKAEEIYKCLLQDDKTRFVGIRGILKQKLEAGDTETAMRLAERAFALKPKHIETQDTLLKLQASCENWSGARKTLSAKLRHGGLPRDVHRRRDAVLALSQARDDMAHQDDKASAREAAIEANRLSPDLVPAAVLAAQVYVEMGKPRSATRVIKKAWESNPHPDLAAAFAAIKPDESAAERLKRFAVLTKTKPNHPETKMLLAELNIAVQDFPAARQALGDLVETEPTARALTIMAAIERGQGSEDSAVRGWLTKALTASRGAQWVCESCKTVHSEWQPVCSDCDTFDSLSWSIPKEGEVAMPESTKNLPLVVGEIAQAPEPAADEAEILPEEPSSEPEVVADGEVVALGGKEKG
ncbi:MAG: heme biosynthesis protein HemY [Rhodobacterales bacterium]|nr:MAG: heme biosynthesis protein HemY [Rhodobacterales bacterium]